MRNGWVLLIAFFFSCNSIQKTTVPVWLPYDETEELAISAKHESAKMRFKLIQSKILDKNENWKMISAQIRNFSEQDYLALKPLILEQDIPTIQSHISSGALTYEKLTQWYLYRIAKFENDKSTFLNNIISINPDAVKEARKKDRARASNNHPIFGMPVLLKDNINVKGMATTAGAYALLNNKPANAFIAERILAKGGIILGKANLSEWANYLCVDCPNGYSAVGGQTLNPYGRKIFETGGSSSGSGSATAANYAVAAVGTETSGSILSPASANSVAGLKPTTGLLSRGGIVPISGTLDTPGPMTRNMIDNAILLSAMAGEDPKDDATKDNPKDIKYWEEIKSVTVKGLRFGVIKSFLKDSLYKVNVEKIVLLGGIAIELEPEQSALDGFGTLLSADMKNDLPDYIKKYASSNISTIEVEDFIAYNRQDSSLKIPYGQGRFEGILKVNLSPAELQQLRIKIRQSGKDYFEKLMEPERLDCILSIANRSAGIAAAANYPCLTVPMGYRANGEPAGITFIARPFEEVKLLKIGYAFEQATRKRKIPEAYR